mmetsp:Transcript_61774/g.162263  ORF Transcript_61774/g.162263 Transcript_61774/m.162263 type:complete len:345 (-) Transcript_61774:885-1919(-)
MRSKAYVGMRKSAGTFSMPKTVVFRACQSMAKPSSQSRPRPPSRASTSWTFSAFGCRMACTKAGILPPSGMHLLVSALRVLPGPTSSTAVGCHCDSIFSAFWRQCTVPRMWPLQYLPSRSCAALIQPPVRFEATGIVEVASSSGMPRPCSVSAASATRPEWKAFRTWSLAHFLPAALSSASRAPTASASPEITACSCEFTAASQSPFFSPAAIAASSLSDHSETESMAPSLARVSVALARAETMPTAASRVRRPPVTAATYSPSEWPATATGLRPTARRTNDRAYSTTKRLGCSTEGRENSRSRSCMSPPRTKTRGRRSKPRWLSSLSSLQQRSTAWRKSGTCS